MVRSPTPPSRPEQGQAAEPAVCSEPSRKRPPPHHTPPPPTPSRAPLCCAAAGALRCGCGSSSAAMPGRLSAISRSRLRAISSARCRSISVICGGRLRVGGLGGGSQQGRMTACKGRTGCWRSCSLNPTNKARPSFAAAHLLLYASGVGAASRGPIRRLGRALPAAALGTLGGPLRALWPQAAAVPLLLLPVAALLLASLLLLLLLFLLFLLILILLHFGCLAAPLAHALAGRLVQGGGRRRRVLGVKAFHLLPSHLKRLRRRAGRGSASLVGGTARSADSPSICSGWHSWLGSGQAGKGTTALSSLPGTHTGSPVHCHGMQSCPPACSRALYSHTKPC